MSELPGHVDAFVADRIARPAQRSKPGVDGVPVGGRGLDALAQQLRGPLDPIGQRPLVGLAQDAGQALGRPCLSGGQDVSGSVVAQPVVTAGMTASGLKTPKIAVTASPLSRPMQPDREQKYPPK